MGSYFAWQIGSRHPAPWQIGSQQADMNPILGLSGLKFSTRMASFLEKEDERGLQLELLDEDEDISSISPPFLDSLLAKMTRSGSGKKRKGEKRKLPDGEINDSAVTPKTRRTRKDGGALVPVCSIRLLASIIVLLTLIATGVD